MTGADRRKTPIGDTGQALKLLVLAAAVAAAVYLFLLLAHVLLLAFGAVLVAVLLRAAGDLFHDHTPLGPRWSLLAGGLLILLVLGGFLAIFGSQLQAQLGDLAGRLPDLLRTLEERFGIRNIESWLRENVPDLFASGGLAAGVASVSTSLVSAIVQLGLAVAAGIYLAARPDLYRRGLLKLVPRDRRPVVAECLDLLASALRRWLLGQLAAMAIVGALTATGLWLLGIRSALALGFIAALLEFVPFVGPILAALPAILVGLAEGLTTALWVLLLYVLVQALEGNVISPLVQQRAVYLPPALTILAITGFGMLFGAAGVLLGTPLAVLAHVLVKRLWVRGALGEETEIPGERRRSGG